MNLITLKLIGKWVTFFPLHKVVSDTKFLAGASTMRAVS